MKSNGKTIRQIADEIGVSKQAIFNKIKKEPLSSSLRQFTSTIDRTLYISIDGERLIKQGYCENERKPVDDKQSSIDDNQASIVDDEVYSVLKSALDVLQQQLTVKDKQIEDLNDRLAEAHKMADQAQQLHGVDKALELNEQQLVTDGTDKTGRWERLKQFVKGK